MAGGAGKATLFHEVRTADVDEDQGSRDAAFADHGENLCRWALVGLAVESRSSEAVGEQGGKRLSSEMVEVDTHRSLREVGHGPGIHLAGGGKWAGIHGLHEVVVVDDA